MIALSLLHVFEIMALAGGWTLTGHACLPAGIRSDPNRPLVWATSLALGGGATAMVLTTLAMLHVFGRLAALVVAGMTLSIGAVELVRLRSAGGWSFSLPLLGDRSERAAMFGVAVVLAATLFVTLAPPSSMDATLYHLRVPFEFMKTGTWTKLEESQSFQPLYVEMLFGEGLAVGGGVVAALVHWALGLGAIAVASAWGRRLGGSAIWGAVIFGATALYVWEASSAFIDLGLALFSSLALFWATRTEEHWEPTALAGIFGGLAAGTKFTGLIAAALTGIASFAMVLPEWKRGARRVVAIGSISGLVALPWYLRDFILTGNPIYPLANRLFGLKPIIFSSITYGIGRDFLHLLSSPFDLLARGEVFDQGWSVGPSYLALVPLGLLALRSRLASVVAACIFGWWLAWFYSSPQTRLLLPVMPMAAGLASVGMTSARASASRALRLAASAIVALGLLGALGTAALAAKTNGKVVLGIENQSQYLERNSWNYVAYEAVNRLLPADATVSVSGANNLYYLERRASTSNPDGLSAEMLRAAGFTHELQIAVCPLPPTVMDRSPLTEGTYPLRASRLAGGVYAQLCYRVSSLSRGAGAAAQP